MARSMSARPMIPDRPDADPTPLRRPQRPERRSPRGQLAGGGFEADAVVLVLNR